MASDSHTHLQLPVLSASEAQARAQIARAGIGLVLPEGPGAGPAPTLSMELVPGSHLTHPWTTPQVVERLAFEWSGSRFFIDVTPASLHDWIAATLPGVTLTQVPAAWSDAAVEAAVSWLTRSLGRLGKGPLRFVGHSRQDLSLPPGVRHVLNFTLAFEAEGHQVPAVLHTDSLGLILLARLLPPAANTAASEDETRQAWEGLPVALQLTIGMADVPFRELNALTTGDVVFMSHRFVDEHQHLKLRSAPFGGQCWSVSARLENHHLLLTESPTIMSDTAENSETPGEAADLDTSAALHQLPIRLSFDVGHKTLTWAELTRLTAGDTLALDGPTSEYVTVRANGAVIGKGHLVELDNRLAVALDVLHPPGAAVDQKDAA